MIGSIMFLMLCTRPDICFAVGKLSQYSTNPRKPHLAAVKRLFGYLKYTKEMNLVFKNGRNFSLEGFVDSDWGSCIDSRKSTSGYFFKLASCAVTWKSQKQRTVALSSAEAEYVAQSVSVQEVMWLRSMMKELSETQDNETLIVHSDSQSAINLAKNPVLHGRSKHIDIRFHFIRNAINEGIVKLKYVPTNDNPADILTKAVDRIKHEGHVAALGLQPNLA
jgi:hypothetical protein